MAFANKLKELLLANNMKAVDLSRETGLSEGVISEYLSGKKEPRGKQSISIAKALQVSLDELWETEFANLPGNNKAPAELPEPDKKICAVFANNLNRIMAEKAIKQNDIANQLRVSKDSVSAWCSGQNIPHTGALSGLVQMLDIELSDLLIEKKQSHISENSPSSATAVQIMDIVRQMSLEEQGLYLENLKTLRRLQEQGRKPGNQD